MHKPQLGYILTAIVSLVLGFGLSFVLYQNNHEDIVHYNPLRSSRYELIRPLLLSESGNDGTTSAMQKQSQAVTEIVNRHISDNSITSASVFYRDLSSGEQINLNGDEKYFPASLSKLPLMMAYYKLAESNADLLSTRGVLDLAKDYNSSQEIKPEQQPVSGNEYSIQELIEMMIKYSDNAGFELLFTKAGADRELKEVFNDLQLFYPYEQSLTKDVFTTVEYARFFRLLYNATYLNEKMSQSALALLSEATYKNGIRAGVDKDILVAHKFGLHTQRDSSGVLTGRQFHDCGIVYSPDKPYLLCVMTKSGSGASLGNVEQAVADISKYIYTSVAN